MPPFAPASGPSRPKTIGLKRRIAPKPMKAGLAPRPGSIGPSAPRVRKARPGTIKLNPLPKKAGL